MYAVIATGGKQYRVATGDTIKVEKLEAEFGDQINFDKVLLFAENDKVEVGAPYLTNIMVKGEVVRQGRGDKIRILHFERRKHHMKQQGHRQDFTEVKITDIGTTKEA